MKKKKMLLIFSCLVIFVVSALFYESIYIEFGKFYMFMSGKVSQKYVDFVMNRKGEMKIHSIVKYGEKSGKNIICQEIYADVADYYIKKKEKRMVLEVFASRLAKDKYMFARSKIYRELILQKKNDIEIEFIREIGTDKEMEAKLISFIRYIRGTGFEDQNIDTLQDIAPILKTKEQIYYVYQYLVYYHQHSKNPYSPQVLKVIEKDLNKKLTKEEIDKLFGRGK